MLAFIQMVTSYIPSGTVLAGIGMVVEAVLRLVPSQKPLSVMYFLQDLFSGLSQLFTAVGNALNSIVPQRIAAPAPQVAPAGK